MQARTREMHGLDYSMAPPSRLHTGSAAVFNEKKMQMQMQIGSQIYISTRGGKKGASRVNSTTSRLLHC